jgi:hypothetical protein
MIGLISRNIYSFTVLILLVCASYSVYSQGGSNYSTIGIGDIKHAGGAYYDGAAGAATALPSATHINLSNPAMWTYNKDTRLQFGYRFNQQLVETGSTTGEASLYQNNGMVDNMTAMFALDTTRGISASLGLSRISDINYYIAEGFEVEKDGLIASGNTFYQGDGGINNAHLGAAFRIFDIISIGTSLGYYFGDVQQSVETVFNEQTGTPTDYIRDVRISGVNYKLGVDVAVTPQLNIAASLASDFGVERENRLIRLSRFTPRGRTVDTLESTSGDGSLPPRIGLGASYKINRLRFVGDFQFLNIEGFGFRPPSEGTLENGISLAFGVERTPSRFAGARFGEKVSFRLGAGYEDLYYQVRGEDISEFFVSGGLTVPMPGTALLDMSIALGQRGTLEQSLVRESFIRLNFAVSIGDTWFIPFEREFD